MTFTVASCCKIYKFPPLRRQGHVVRTQNNRMPKEIATAIMEGKGK
jgi:hypothetical protein